MTTINFCRWLTFQRTRRYYGWNLAERLKNPALREEFREWSLRENELAIVGWSAPWLTIAAIAVVPGSWVMIQWAPRFFAGFLVVLVIGPLSGVLCMLEIYVRWLIGLVSPGSPVALPGGPSIIEGNSLLVSSLATYLLIPILYIFIDRVLLTA